MDRKMNNDIDGEVYLFNEQVKVINAISEGKDTKMYKIIDLEKEIVYELDSKSYFLCRLCDGKTSIDDIARIFKMKTEEEVNKEQLTKFFKNLEKAGIISKASKQREILKRGKEDNEAYTYEKILEKSKKEEEISILEEDDISVPSFSVWIWQSKNPVNTLKSFNQAGHLITSIYKVMGYSLWIIFPTAILILLNNTDQVKYDYTTYVVNEIPNLFGLLGIAGLQASIANITTGVISQSYRNPPKRIRFGLLFCFIPKIVIEINAEYLTAKQRSIMYASALKMRMIILSISIYLWNASHGYGNNLPFYAIIFIMTGVIGLLVDLLPLWPSPGYYLLISSRKYNDIIKSTISIWLMILKGIELPKEISEKEVVVAKLLGIVGLLEVIVTFTIIISFLSRGISDILVKDIFGNGARPIVAIVLWLFACNVINRFWKAMNAAQENRLQNDLKN